MEDYEKELIIKNKLIEIDNLFKLLVKTDKIILFELEDVEFTEKDKREYGTKENKLKYLNDSTEREFYNRCLQIRYY